MTGEMSHKAPVIRRGIHIKIVKRRLVNDGAHYATQ